MVKKRNNGILHNNNEFVHERAAPEMNIFETGGSFYSVARNKRMMTKKLRVIDP